MESQANSPILIHINHNKAYARSMHNDNGYDMGKDVVIDNKWLLLY